jgi:DNA-binding CsgD family transcriptional regulator
MPSIVVFNDEGNVVYQNTVDDVHELVKTIREGGDLPGFSESPPAVRINGLIILAEQSRVCKRPTPKLTQKQCQVLQCLANSLTPEQTAMKMGLSEESIRLYLKILKKKFKTESRDQLMAMAGYLGLCNPYQNEPPEAS